MILEGIVTTVSAHGDINIAPMGPHIGESMDRFTLRPFRTSQTYQNLKATSVGVLHVTDDVLLLARAAIGTLSSPLSRRANVINGFVLADCCRYYEFRVESVDDREERSRFEVRTVHHGRVRDFFGFNRAKHAVVEGAILATRIGLVPMDEIEAEFARLTVLVKKTGGSQEHEAWQVLCEHLAAAKEKR
jgi:hypothetical protein